jgi:crossover junction endodeoxyribonuclease RusA
MVITIKLPWPPSANKYYRSVNNRAILSLEARQYRDAVVAKFSTPECMTGRLDVYITAVPPNLIRRDLDNMLKQPLDALQHAGWYKDDSQIDFLCIQRRKPNKKDPHLLVTIDDGSSQNSSDSTCPEG